MEKGRANVVLYAAVVSVNLLSFCIGSGFSWTSPVLPKLGSTDPTINPIGSPTTTFEDSWIAGLICVGAAISPFISGPISEKLGRKRTMLIFTIPILLSHLLCAFGTTVHFFLMGRLMLGVGLGCVFSALPSYVGEISEDSNRGLLGGLMGVSINVAILLNYAIGPLVSIRTLSFINLVPVCLFYVTFGLFMPESPYYFVAINNYSKAEESLRKLRANPEGFIRKELMYITNCVEEAQANKGTFRDLFQSKSLKRGLLISCGLMVAQQLSGICAVLGYMQSIFDASGSTISSHLSAVMVGCVQLLITIFTTSLVDRLGRKVLLLFSSAGSSLSLLCLGTYFYLKNSNVNVDCVFWLPIVSLMIFIGAYNLGLGSLPWTVMGELFSSNVKSIASSITSCICMASAFFITMFFPYLSLSIGMAGSFLLFAGFSAMAILFTVFLVPETKGKSLSEIQLLLSGNDKK